jgi:hypothetical protein
VGPWRLWHWRKSPGRVRDRALDKAAVDQAVVDGAMSGSQNTIICNKLGRLGLLAQTALLIAVALLVWLATCPLAYWVSGTPGLLAAAVAAGICLLGAGLALGIAALFRGPAAAMHGMMLGMLARMVFPLLLGVTLYLKVPALAAAGLIYYLLVFYMATLAIDTLLLLARVPVYSPSEEMTYNP